MDMEKIGMEIVKECAGLPLPIIVLGGIFATKLSLSEWEKMHRNVDLCLSKGKGINQEYSVVYGVLALSYNELPYHLKPCFLHLRHFPEDYDIHCQTLFKLWAAEGFVPQCQRVGEGNETRDDIVERYLHDLIDRSIVQVSQMGSTGGVKTCRLHDLMRDFCLSKASEENYLEIVRPTNLNEKPNSNRVHRLVVHPNDLHDFDLENYARTPYLRSFLLFGFGTGDWSEELMICDNPMITSIFNYFKLFKVLSLENCRIGKKVAKEIGGLIHLRYLAFDDCEIDDIPSSIGNLRYLQTLIIRSDSRTIVPNVLWKLEQLKHLVLAWCEIKGGKMLKLGGNMSKLETLELGESIECDLGQNTNVSLNRLSSLCINVRDRSEEEFVFKFITTLRQLEITDMLYSFRDRVRVVDGEEGEDFYKIRHVPSIIIRDTRTMR